MLRELRDPFETWIRALVVIGVVWTVVALARTRRMPRGDAIRISVAEALFVASIASIWAFTIVRRTGPLIVQDATPLNVNLVPLITVVQDLMSFDRDVAAVNAIGNIALFIPFGAATLWRFDVGPWRVALLGLLLSIAIEVWQSLPSTARSGDINDVIFNGVGTFIGASGMTLVVRSVPALAVRR